MVRREAKRIHIAPRRPEAALTPIISHESHLVLDDVHSFVLRLYLNPAPGGRGRPRPQFSLEHVNLRKSRRMQTLDQALKELTDQIELVLKSWEGETN